MRISDWSSDVCSSDLKAPDRDDYRWETTVGEQRRASVHVHDGVSEDEFVAMREARDATLAVPKLLLPSIQVNIRGGRFPAADANGVRFQGIQVKIKDGIEKGGDRKSTRLNSSYYRAYSMPSSALTQMTNS